MGAGLGDVGVVGWVRIPYSSVPRKDTCLPRINHGVSIHHMKNLESQPSDNNSNSEMGGVNHRPSLLWTQQVAYMDEPERDQFLLKEAKHDLQGVFDELDIERSPFDLQRELTRKYGATYGARAVRMAFYDF